MNDDLKNALRKIIADNTAGVIFNMLNLFDGTSYPRTQIYDWKGVKLVDEKANNWLGPVLTIPFTIVFETYWDWKKLRGENPGKLDTCED